MTFDEELQRSGMRVVRSSKMTITVDASELKRRMLPVVDALESMNVAISGLPPAIRARTKWVLTIGDVTHTLNGRDLPEHGPPDIAGPEFPPAFTAESGRRWVYIHDPEPDVGSGPEPIWRRNDDGQKLPGTLGKSGVDEWDAAHPPVAT